MKQLIALIASGLLVLTLTACGDNNTTVKPTTTDETQKVQDTNKTTTDGQMKKEDTGTTTTGHGQ